MDTASFLSSVLASVGYVCIVTPNPSGAKGFHQYICHSYEHAARKAAECSAKGVDTFFAVGTLKSRGIPVQRPDGSTRIAKRVAENISHMRSWIVDIDVGDDPKKYRTQAEAVTHLARFCSEMGFPKPMLVSSGYGIHAYWRVSADVPVDLWQLVARKFEAVLSAYGLLVDHSRTADVSSILRVAGTDNHKRGGTVPVRVLYEGAPPVPPKTFLDIVNSAAVALRVKPDVGILASRPSHTQAFDTGLGAVDTPSEPADLITIAKKCPQMHAIAVARGDVPEPLWYAGIQVLKFCKVNTTAGAPLIHYLSQGHANYTAEETDAKLAQCEGYGPTLCSTFDTRNPGVCCGCPNFGKVKSPIVLGKNAVIEEATPPIVELPAPDGTITEIAIPQPPAPYFRTAKGELARRMWDAETREHVAEVFYEYDVYPTRRMFDEASMTEMYYFRSWLPRDGWREYPIPANTVYDKKQLFMSLASRGVLPKIEYQNVMVEYMLAYMKHLQTAAEASTIYAQMGWRRGNAEFVCGDVAYKSDGSSETIKLDEQYATLRKNFGQAGTLPEWKRVTNMYNQPGYEAFAFAFMVGFGAPAFRFTEYDGGIISLCGDSGTGKSTALEFVHSIYGVPKCDVLLTNDTVNARYAVLGAYNNLPVTFDEVTNMDKEVVSDLVYAVTNGRVKQRLNTDSSIKTNVPTWKLPMFVSTNKGVVQTLAFKADNSGEVMRVLELRTTHVNKYAFSDARKLLAPLANNYGVAGPILLSWYVQHPEETTRLLEQFTDAISRGVNAHVSERFWVTMCAIALLGCHVGRRLGLHDYSETAIVDYIKSVVFSARKSRDANARSGVDVLVDYLNKSMPHTLVVHESANRDHLAHVHLRPHNGLTVRSELRSRKIYIDRVALRAYCTAISYDFSKLQLELEAADVLLRADGRKRLGEDTEYLGGVTKVWVVNAAHPLMAGTAAMAIAPAEREPAVKAVQ